MKVLGKSVFVSLLLILSLSLQSAFAASSPPLNTANTFAILSSTYTNTAIGTTVNGDVGYTTAPVVAPTINGTTHVADTTYNQAGIDQGTALAALNSQPCTFNFAPGAIDLATDVTHGPVGVYVPGVYCITGAASIGGGGTITLSGTGTYIFRMDGALTTSANSVVQVADSASVCTIWWTPTQATTLGADSTFLGTDIDAAGITIGNNVTWTGRALAFGGTVSTDADTITVPICTDLGYDEEGNPIVRVPVIVPGLPRTDVGSSQENGILARSILVFSLVALPTIYLVQRKNKSNI